MTLGGGASLISGNVAVARYAAGYTGNKRGQDSGAMITPEDQAGGGGHSVRGEGEINGQGGT